MKFGFVESQKHAFTRDERSWVIGMAEACININDVALHFDINLTTAYRIMNRFGASGIHVWLETTRDRADKKE